MVDSNHWTWKEGLKHHKRSKSKEVNIRVDYNVRRKLKKYFVKKRKKTKEEFVMERLKKYLRVLCVSEGSVWFYYQNGIIMVHLGKYK